MGLLDLSNLGFMLQIQSISESVLISYRLTKTLKGVLLTFQKDKLPGSTSTGPNDV